MIYFYNTLTRQKEIFEPLDPSCVKMYVCGPTVYNYIHIGNARAMIVFDLVYRLLKKKYPKVIYARNITDIDDKIINKSKESGVDADIVAETYTRAFAEDMKSLGCLEPDIQPKVTDHISEIILLIERLIDNKHAYIRNGEVYFDIKSFPDYGKLAKRDLRVSREDDFVLWKADSNNPQHLFYSPWGKGRPGWHIECSAMSWKHLGENFDIHGGGQDLCFPHHENEIAQSKCAFPGSGFAKFWIHNGFVNIKEEKMSKSLGNFLTVRDLIAVQGVRGEIIRYALLTTHYRQILNWDDNLLTQAKHDLNRLYRALEGYEHQHDQISEEIQKALEDDLNVPLVIQALHCIVNKINVDKKKKSFWQNILKNSAALLGILRYSYVEWFTVGINEQIMELIKKRKEARLEKNYALSDQIRNQIEAMGVQVMDLANGECRWEKLE